MVDTIRSKEYRDFVGKLRQARLDAGLRQIDVAKKLKHTQSYVPRVEIGERSEPISRQDFARNTFGLFSEHTTKLNMAKVSPNKRLTL